MHDPESCMAALPTFWKIPAIQQPTPVCTALRWQGCFCTALADRGAHVSGLFTRLCMAAGPPASLADIGGLEREPQPKGLIAADADKFAEVIGSLLAGEVLDAG